ncbi:hypothetical protein DNTS_008386 [Danionella cerebrum]|uniref:Uncharacterized protein n=1 Tax=Danionella cerebrum TaxID=2873325 RepID=A0A553N0W8_9TELE|nr:hypothetical protein DNTS_008386 [Danionella translucida]
MAPKKGDKAAPKKGDKGKAEAKQETKAAKDDKKGGKGGKEPPKGKGKEDPKKGKGKGKQAPSESEEASEVEKSEVEDSEALDEEDAQSEDDGGKQGKGKAALKGASKAVAMKAGAKPKRGQAAEEAVDPKTGKRGNIKAASKAVAGFQPEEKKPQLQLGKMKDINLKGASSAMMGFAVQGQQNAEKKDDAKAGLKGASKVLTGLTGKSPLFAKPAPKQSKRGLKTTSRLFMGLSGSKKKKGMTPKALQSTSKLFSGFGKSKAEEDKNKKEEGGRTLLLLNIGGKSTKNATFGLGGKFKGFFGKKKTGAAQFKSKGWALGKISGATNWLTNKFISSKTSRLGRSVRYDRSSLGRYHGYQNGGYEYDDGEFSYEEDDYVQSTYSRNNPRGLYRGRTDDSYGQGRLRGPHQYEYFEDDEEYYDYGEDEYGFYDEENDYYDPMYEDEYGYFDEDYYDQYEGRQPYGYYDDRMDYGYRHQRVDEFGYPIDEMEYYDEMGYGMEDEFGYLGSDVEYYGNGYYADQFDIYGAQPNYYQYDGASDAYVMYPGFPAAYNQNQYIYSPENPAAYIDSQMVANQPFMYTVEDVMKPAEPTEMYGQEYVQMPTEGILTDNSFRFPRPQTKPTNVSTRLNEKKKPSSFTKANTEAS